MVGYPNAVYRLVGHPVSWIGKFITWCDEAWNSGPRSSRRLYGVLTLTLLVVVAVLSGLYFTVSTSVDPLYRQRFFDPLIADVAVSLAGRDAYLEMENGRI